MIRRRCVRQRYRMSGRDMRKQNFHNSFSTLFWIICWTSESEGRLGMAPLRSMQMLAAALAKQSASSSLFPSHIATPNAAVRPYTNAKMSSQRIQHDGHRRINPPVNVSPAPVVSTTWLTLKAGCLSTRSSDRRSEPREPSFTNTFGTPLLITCRAAAITWSILSM